jgi:hypothetical protein
MFPSAWRLTLALALVSLLALACSTARAQVPARAYYVPPPAVTCYSPPVVVAPVPVVSYYAPPVVAYAPPAPLPYYAAPSVVTTTRYGLFGRPRVTTSYYAPAYVYR